MADPNLGHVLCGGEPEDELIAALGLMCERVDLAPGVDPVDTVVLSRPTVAEIEQAHRLLRPGGWMYVETGGLLRARSRGRTAPSAHDCARIVASLGFEEVEIYWHVPNFRSCTEIVSLSDRSALFHSLRRRRRTVVARAKVAAAQAAVRAGALGHLVPAASVVAHLPVRHGSP